METQAFFLFSMLIGLIAFSLIGKWYLGPWLDAVSRAAALTPLLLLHSFRYVGMAFIAPGVVEPDLAAAFAYPAAYGDLLASVLALLALGAVRLRWPVALPLVWLFNVAGTLDMFYAIFQGTRNAIAEHLGAAYFIPTLVVPVLLVTHYLIFRLLVRRDDVPSV